MKKAVGRKVCGFKIVGRINELDNRWRFRRWFRKQLSLESLEVEFSTRIYQVYRSTAPFCRDFLLKSYISFARFPGTLVRSYIYANRSALTSSQGTMAVLVRVPLWSSAGLHGYVISSHPQHLSFFDSKWKSVLGIVLSVVIIAERAIHWAINTALQNGARDAFFIVFERRARFTRVGLEKSSPRTFKRIMKTW